MRTCWVVLGIMQLLVIVILVWHRCTITETFESDVQDTDVKDTVTLEQSTTQDGLPRRRGFQKLKLAHPSDGGVRTPQPGGLILWEDSLNRVPLHYSFPEYENDEILTSYEIEDVQAPKNVERSRQCQGHWAGNICIYDGDDCSTETSDQLRVWRRTQDGYV